MILYDYSKLRGRIVEKFGGQQAFSKAIGQSERTVSLKLNNRVSFKQSDIELWSSALELGKDDIVPYFFTQEVQSA